MTGTTSSTKGVLRDFPTMIISKIGREPTRESLIDLYWSISGNESSLVLNLGGGRNGHLMLTITKEDYISQTGYTFLPPKNLVNYPAAMGTSQAKALGTEIFQNKLALFIRCITMDKAIEKQIITEAKPVFLYPPVNQLVVFGRVTALQTIQHLLNPYRAIYEIDLEENAVKIMRS